MSLSAFRVARAETCEFLDREGVVDHMFHGPVSDSYWEERFKAVAINMEAYGYAGRYGVDRKTLIDWLYDAGNTDTKTTRYTLTILAVLLRRRHDGAVADWGAMQRAYADGPLLETTLDRTVYYNIRPDTNVRKEQDYDAIAGVGHSPVGPLLWREIVALDPDVLFVSGKAGLAALNGIAGLPRPLEFRGLARHPLGFLIQSISHPSRPRYNAWAEAIEGIAKAIEGKEVKSCQG